MLLQKLPRLLSIEEVVQTCRLDINDPTMPNKIARFVKIMGDNRLYRRFRRMGTVGSIDTVNPATQSTAQMAWSIARSASVASGLPTALSITGPGNGATQVRQPVSYTYGSSGVGAINQLCQVIMNSTSIAASGTNNFAMDVITNLLGEATATVSAVKELWIELLTTTQGGGANASSITMGDHATNAWAAILGATGTYDLASGGMWHHQDQSSAGLTVAAGDKLKTVNNDGANAATVRVTVFGFK